MINLSPIHFVQSLYNTAHRDIAQPVQRDVINPVHRFVNPNYGYPKVVPAGQPITPPQGNNFILKAPDGSPSYGPTYVHDSNGNAVLVPTPSRLDRIGSTVKRGVIGAVEAINPWDAESKANNLINQTNSAYKFTPAFKQNLDKANPTFTKNNPIGGEFVGGYVGNPGLEEPQQHGIKLKQNQKQTPETIQDELVHEGLHRTFDKKPQERQRFLQAYKQSTNPALEAWLSKALKGYEFQVPQPNQLNSLDNLPEHLIDEAHSYIPQYYAQTSRTATPAALDGSLADYYSQYFDPSYANVRHQAQNTVKKTQIMNQIQRMLNPPRPMQKSKSIKSDIELGA